MCADADRAHLTDTPSLGTLELTGPGLGAIDLTTHSSLLRGRGLSTSASWRTHKLASVTVTNVTSFRLLRATAWLSLHEIAHLDTQRCGYG